MLREVHVLYSRAIHGATCRAAHFNPQSTRRDRGGWARDGGVEEGGVVLEWLGHAIEKGRREHLGVPSSQRTTIRGCPPAAEAATRGGD
jgi:hypothetical protein